MATSVTYDTNGVFTGPDAVAGSLINDGSIITMVNQAAVTVNSPTNISLGDVIVTPPASGTAMFAGDTLTLTILESNPTLGNGLTQAMNVTGTITSVSDTLDLKFAPTTIVIGNETYQLASDYLLVAPNTNAGSTSIQASLVSRVGATIPEPSIAGMFLTGMLGCLGGFWFTRKRKV